MLKEKLISVAPVAAAAIFLSISTQLRFPGLPVGVSEVFIVGLAALLMLRDRVAVLRHCKSPFMIFWALFILTAAIGHFTSSERGAVVVHTGIAYIYIAIFTQVALVYVADMNKVEFYRLIRAMITMPVLLLFIPLSLFVCGNIWFSELIDVNTAFYPSRLAAWSANPNQLALLLLPIPIWLAAISQRAHWQGMRLIKKFLFLWFLFFLGFCVRSDALLLAWCLGIPLVTILTSYWSKVINWRVTLTIIMALLLAFICFKFFFDGFGQQFLDDINTKAKHNLTSHHSSSDSHNKLPPDFVEVELKSTPLTHGKSDSLLGVGLDPNKTGVRITLWAHAIETWKLSPIFGHGPGAFSYLNAPSEKQEAHNLLLDILTQAGILGVFLFGSLILWLFSGAIKARDPFSLALLMMLIVFCSVHFTLRQPVFMMYLMIIAIAVKKGFFVRDNDCITTVIKSFKQSVPL